MNLLFSHYGNHTQSNFSSVVQFLFLELFRFFMFVYWFLQFLHSFLLISSYFLSELFSFFRFFYPKFIFALYKPFVPLLLDLNRFLQFLHRLSFIKKCGFVPYKNTTNFKFYLKNWNLQNQSCHYNNQSILYKDKINYIRI